LNHIYIGIAHGPTQLTMDDNALVSTSTTGIIKLCTYTPVACCVKEQTLVIWKIFNQFLLHSWGNLPKMLEWIYGMELRFGTALDCLFGFFYSFL